MPPRAKSRNIWGHIVGSFTKHFEISIAGSKEKVNSGPIAIERKIPIEPYPVTFSSNSSSPVDVGKHMGR